MIFPESGWIKYINVLSAINNTAAKKFTAYLNTHDVSTKIGRKAAIDYAYAIATQYGESAAAAACEMYDAVAEASGITLPAAEPAQTASYGDVAKAINGLEKQNQPNDVIGESIGRLVKRAGADTTLKNAKRDGAEFAWIPHGDTCAFCLMLASNGWKTASKKTVKGDHAEHIHANCDCTFAIRFDGKSTVEGYDPDKYREMYDNSDGDTWQEKLNSMRRAQYEKDGNAIRKQKREAYARKNEYTSVLSKYLDSATPGAGDFEIKEGRVVKNNEEFNAALIHSKFGGNLILPKESKTPGAHNPDYIWKGKDWEEQEPKAHTRNAIDSNIREAIHQIANNPGGIVLDIGNNEMPIEEINDIVLRRLRRSSPYNCDVMIIRDGKIEEIFRYKKIKE